VLYQDGDPTFRQAALFGDLTFHVTSEFDVQLGARESRDRLTVPSSIEIYGPSVISMGAYGAKDDVFTYLATPRYRITPELMLYVRVASGYRPGDPNFPSPGVPEQSRADKVKSYEIGFKGEFIDHRFFVDASLYYIDWSNIQLSLVSDQGFAYSANGGSAK